MVITLVTATHLRCHQNARIECGQDITILSGPNGSGKTSLLEAISVCSLGTSFVPVQDTSLIQEGSESCLAITEALSDERIPYRVGVEIREGVRKKISSTHGTNISVKELIGELPIVALSPDHKSITFGSPSDRRSFLDAVMAQCSRRYTELLYEHKRVLKHRNALLSGKQHQDLSVWTDKFIELSAEIVEKRRDFLAMFAPIVQDEYRVVSSKSEEIELIYMPDGIEISASDSKHALMVMLKERHDTVRDKEFIRETTCFGPHRDDIDFVINKRSVKDTASQGQHKTLLISLKLAECAILREQRRERPIVLLDDIFAELDDARASSVLQRIVHLGLQSFITTTDGDSILQKVNVEQGPTVVMYSIDKGVITRVA